ncbi:MAG: hypothetical protein HJJLKODD_00946 [Phycisphaerae bacterium]|nr:hypothetical protein [Phycisphaerae bacterium]
MRYRDTVLMMLLVVGLGGCVVPQPSGKGDWFIKTEARHGMSYYLYLPEDYVKRDQQQPADKKWPIVMTFHGMRPWDSAGAQIMEWQQEADRYGFVVIAPSTRISDLLGELPLRHVNSSLKADERDVLAVLDEVVANYDVDPRYVLSTSWSMGGYLAHYMVNRHPDRFSCLAVRQSNFSADILDPAQVPKYRHQRMAVFYTKNDFNICQRESQEAIAWYRQFGFDIIGGIVDNLGHERTPEVAAAFFAETCGAVAKTPPTELATRITIEASPVAPIQSSPRPGVSGATPPRPANAGNAAAQQTPPRPSGAQPIAQKSSVAASPNPPKGSGGAKPLSRTGTNVTKPPAARVASGPAVTNRPPTRSAPTPPAKVQQLPTQTIDLTQRPQPTSKPATGEAAAKTATPRENSPLNVKLSAYIGISPMLISYTVQMPAELMKDADVLWMDNGQPISRGISGQKSLVEPGQHRLEVLVVASDNKEYRASKTVTVLERLAIDDESSD